MAVTSPVKYTFILNKYEEKAAKKGEPRPTCFKETAS